MSVQQSPALPPMRPGLLDPSRQAEYPILLGESLSGNRANGEKQLLNVRYNWKSKQIPQRQLITNNHSLSESYKLVVREGTSEPYKYSGTTDPKTTDADSAYLALVFDKEKSAFVLESISKSLNFNLTSATTKPNIDQLPQLETVGHGSKDASERQDQDGLRDSDEDAVDADNPYDYRHFLAEAKKEAVAGSLASKPPTMGTASPMTKASKTLTANKPITTLQSPFMGPSKRRKVDAKPTPRDTPRSSQTGGSNASRAKSKTNAIAAKGRAGHNSAEKITSSDDEGGKAVRTRGTVKSQTYAPSPQIIVDEASDLTIDMGSPPLKAKAKHRINPDAFASHSATQSRANTASVSPQGRHGRGGSDKDAEDDIEMDNSGDDDDEDVEDLALPSPRATRTSSNAMSRVTHDRAVEDDDEDDGLAAELEAVFDQEDEGDNRTVGLGISGGQGHGHGQGTVQDDEESEVSEEE